MQEDLIRLLQVITEEQLEDIKILFKEYEQSLDFKLHFQDFNDEFAKLPGEYALPHGCLILASYKDNIAGCVALRKLDEKICEMKRMYVRPDYRRKGIGRAMAEQMIEFALAHGYERMRLDTIDTMNAAISLYRSLGFVESEPYRYNPIKGASYMELSLLK
jgi:ribosomal protein S18 acetylase RimI-like enzyme